MPMTTSTFPQHPIAAVTHADPYPYYAELVARKPLYFDEGLGLWVASSAAAVTAVLTSELCRVRPPAEPIPKTLLESPAADIFRYLVRMNDGERHHPFKQAVSAALDSVSAARAAEESTKWARLLSDEIGLKSHSHRVSDFAFQLPVLVVASLLGVPEIKLRPVAMWISDFVRCLAPASTPEAVEQGKLAVGHLLDLFRALLAAPPIGSLLAALAREANRVGCNDPAVMVANGIGLMSQAYEATAGLIGNTLVALACHREVREQVLVDARLLPGLVSEVLRYDAPVQNTRRFVAADGIVVGQEMNAGDAILVVLAAANRDPAANPNPEWFDLFREQRQRFTFGHGVHACPGEALALAIAKAGIKQVLASGLPLESLAETVTYRPSANTRIPLFSV